MVIRSNAPALQALRHWTNHNNNVAKAIQRISSGSRINSAADDPAGMAMVEKIKTQLTRLKVSQRNVADGMSMINVADGALSGTQSALNRMYELAKLAMTDTMSDEDRKALNSEYQQLLDEVDRTAKDTNFNSMSLFKNSSAEGSETGQVSDESGDILSIQGGNLNNYLDALDSLLIDISSAAKAGDDSALLSLGIDRSNGKSDQENLRLAVINFTKENAQKLLDSPQESSDGNEFVINIADGNITIQMPGMDKEGLGLSDTNLLSRDDAAKAAEAVKSAMNSVSAGRGSMGAYYNRLEHTMNNLATMEENLTDTLSRISDADIAAEMMTLVKEKMLAQASAFAMAQANQRPDQVLVLIKSL